MNEDWLFYLTPLLIFFARTVDVSIGTIRIICISKNYRVVAAMLGFFEILIWLIAISQIMKNLNVWFNYVAYAGGFAMGNFVGMSIERRIALGRVVFRVIAQEDVTSLLVSFTDADYSYTVIDGKGSKGAVKLVFLVCERKDIPLIEQLIHVSNLKVFYSIEDVRHARRRRFSFAQNIKELFGSIGF